MKVHPAYLHDKDVSSDSQRIKDWLSDLSEGVKNDFDDREGWVAAKEQYFRRRYCLEWRNPDFPWIGSSNIVLPLIDKKIDEMKPQYVNLIAAAHPPVTVHAIDAPSQKKVRNVELWFDWLIRTGSPHFIEEAIYAIDDCLETGRGILSTYWRYETRKIPEVLQRERLPESLKRLIVAKNDEEANAAYVVSGGAALALTKRDFDRNEKGIRQVIYQEFDLDPEEPQDEKAIEEVVSWFRSGARDPIQFQKRDVTVNVPAISAIQPIDFIVPSYTTDLEHADRITEVLYLTERELKQKAADHKLSKSAVDELMQRRAKKKGGHATNRQAAYQRSDMAGREGVRADREESLIELWQICTWVATSEHGKDQKATLLVPSEATDIPLKFCLYPRDRWPYHSFTFEQNKKRWYAPRGVPEKLDDIDAEITEQHRAKLNRMRIANAPTFKVRPNRGINWASWQWQPGTALPCQHPDDVVPFEFQILDGSFDNEINQLRVWAEEYLGGSDFGITNPLSNTEDARTATEINAIQGKARQSLAMRGILFQRCMQEIYEDIFELWHTFIQPGDKTWIKVSGGAEPILITREDLQGRFTFQCTGTIGDNDPQQEAQKALARITILAQLKMEGALEPKYEIDLGEAVQDWMEKDDIRAMKRIIRERSQEEIQQIQQQRAQMMAQQQQQELLTAMAGGKPAGQGKPQARPQSALAGAGAGR